MIKPNSEKFHIKGRPTTAETVKPTSHNLNVGLSSLHE